MRRDGAGQRWESIEPDSIRKYDPDQLRTGTAPLEQTFVRSGEKPFNVRLTFLSSRPALARVLANAFWLVHRDHLRKLSVITCAHCLRLFSRFLDYRMKGQPDITSASQLSADVLKEMAVWLIVERRFRRKTAAHTLSMCCWFLRQAKRLYPEEFDPAFSTPSNLFPGVGNERPPSKALPPEIFHQILAAASKELDEIRRAYVPGDAPTSAQQIIPFMILIGARTGINPDALYSLGRDCLFPHEIDEDCFYLVWDKPRAGKQQRQLHRVDRRQHSGVVELIRFMREYSEPLALQAGPPANTKLFLYRSENTLLRNRLISSCTAPRLSSQAAEGVLATARSAAVHPVPDSAVRRHPSVPAHRRELGQGTPVLAACALLHDHPICPQPCHRAVQRAGDSAGAGTHGRACDRHSGGTSGRDQTSRSAARTGKKDRSKGDSIPAAALVAILTIRRRPTK